MCVKHVKAQIVFSFEPALVRKIARAEINGRVADVLALVGLTDMADKLATQLSGGQQQRASLARAIVSRPRLLLFAGGEISDQLSSDVLHSRHVPAPDTLNEPHRV